MGAYKRRNTRFQTERLPIAIREHGTFGWNRGMLLNLSTTGVLVHSDRALKEGAAIEIEFVTINKQGKKNRRRMMAKVIWHSGSRHGCQFTRSSRV